MDLTSGLGTEMKAMEREAGSSLARKVARAGGSSSLAAAKRRAGVKRQQLQQQQQRQQQQQQQGQGAAVGGTRCSCRSRVLPSCFMTTGAGPGVQLIFSAPPAQVC